MKLNYYRFNATSLRSKFLFDLLNRYYENVFFFFFFFFETLFRKIRFPKKLPVKILIKVIPMDSVAFHLPACMKFRVIFTLPYPLRS